MMLRKCDRLRAVLLVVTALAVASLLAPPSAVAHTDLNIITQIDNVRPRLPDGVDLVVYDGESTQLVLANKSGRPIYVLDPNGRPYLQVSSEGAFGDVESPYLAATTGVLAYSIPAPPGCCPEGEWMRLSPKRGWAWADPRLDPPMIQDPLVGGNRGLATLEQSQPLATWKIGMRQGDQEFTVTGTLERRQLGRLRAEVDSLPEGLAASVINSRTPQIRLSSRQGMQVDVLGNDGHAFIRMMPRGTVGRSASPDYKNHLRAIGLKPTPGPSWVPMVAAEPTQVVWADARLRYSAGPPENAGAKPVVVKRWRVPVVVDGQPGEIRGTTVWEPILPGADETADDVGESTGLVEYLVAGALTLALVAVYWLARRHAGSTGRGKESYADQN